MILHLLAPQSDMISKGKQGMWHYIEENLLPLLSQVAVDAKGKEYSRCLATVAEELEALKEEEWQFENTSDPPVQTAQDDSSLDESSEDD